LAIPCTEAEGPGKRYALWVQGCPILCPGCCNPEMLAFKERDRKSVDDVVADIAAARDRHGVEGVSFLGGEPTRQAAGLRQVAARAQGLGLSVMVFSGYTLQELKDEGSDDVDGLLAATDLLVDGRYVEARRTTARRYIGSDNQVLHFLSDRDRADDPRFAAPNTLELRVIVDKHSGALSINGFPILGAKTR
jgi:anaerobic ribonucleoside-triphosphate reductase activating protein